MFGAILCACVFVTAQASAEQNRPYIELNLNYLQTLDNETTGAVAPGIDRAIVSFHPMAGLGGEIGFGNIANTGVRLAATAEYAKIHPKSVRLTGPGIDVKQTISGEKVDASVYKIKAYYDIDIGNKLIPFIGGAFGIVHSNDETDLAASVIVGINYEITENIYVGLRAEYAYLFAGDTELGQTSEDTQVLGFGLNLGYKF